MVVQRRATPEEQAEIDRQLQALGRGLLDSASLGLADPGVAATKAAVDAAFGADFWGSYHAARTQQRALDQYEQTHYPAYRNVGEAAGAIAPLLLSDGLTLAPTAGRIGFTAPRAADAVGLAMKRIRPYGYAGAAGALASVAGQGVLDAAKDDVSSPETYASDALGGAVGGMATLKRSVAAGAAAGAAVAGGAYSALTGQPFDYAAAAKDANGANLVGLGGYFAGRTLSNGLHFQTKGKLGDWMAGTTSEILGEKVRPLEEGRQRHHGVKVSGGQTIPDHMISEDPRFEKDSPLEAKFGWDAKLSKRQTEANNELPNYVVRHFLPPDVGRITGGLLAIANIKGPSQIPPPPSPSAPDEDGLYADDPNAGYVPSLRDDDEQPNP